MRKGTQELMENKLAELKTRLQEVYNLNSAAALLGWDQATYMPPGSAASRGRQLATLATLSQQKFTDPAVGKLLDELQPYGESLPYDSDDAALIRKTRKDYAKAVKVPPAWVAKYSAHSTVSYQAWAQARPANDFKSVADLLKTTLDLSREYADFFPGYEHIADPLIDGPDPGMKASDIRRVFGELREQLVPIVKTITEQDPADDSPLRAGYPEDEQLAFGMTIAKDYGFDFNRGRQDKSPHPFMTSFAIDDVRITTRVQEGDLSDALFSTLHEVGHALYELGIDPALEGTPLAGGTSSGIHESQSRTWENIVGRSRGFWEHYYPSLQKQFPGQLAAVSLDDFYRAINKVSRSLIRTDADEVTYNLHVMLRFELELEMLEGKLEIKDLPEAWHARYEADLGIRAPSDVDGVLQDVHWYAGLIGGAFQGYTLGNIISALFYEAALKAHPDIPQQTSQGKFVALHGWLKENLYRHGSKFTPNELIERITGGPLRIEPYIGYLKTKYGELYKL
ncbi:MAG: carboxypeptidase M32 [Anaerolineales bacterium]|nr:carboxypeptidase M32 [Anaerolineales bacterium]